jgi:uncharacterized membrane protein
MWQWMRGWTDERVDSVIGRLLQTGVLLSSLVVLAGGILYLLRYGGTHPFYAQFRGEPAGLHSIRGIISSALALESRGIIQFGLLLLVATPVARVAFSVFAFILERDWTYVLVTLIVLAILSYSLVAGS